MSVLEFLNPFFLLGMFIDWFCRSVDSGLDYAAHRRYRKLRKEQDKENLKKLLTTTENKV